MISEFYVSVIIPVYNAAKYVEKAVISALAEDEVAEIILVEDGSPDDAMHVCTELSARYKKVKLLQHPDKGNHGAGASRNLGILNASNQFIAFIDADDFILPGRFNKDKQILLQDTDIDGVYHAVGPISLDENGDKKIMERGSSLMTVNNIYAPENLFENLSPVGFGGFFSLNGLTVRKSVFDRIGLMDPVLRLSQDTDICIKIAAVCRLMPGYLDRPVALYGVHEHNRSHDTSKLTQNRPYLFYQLYKWGKKKGIARERVFLLWQRFYEYNNLVNRINRKQQILLLIKELLKYPILLKSSFYCKQLPFIYRFIN